MEVEQHQEPTEVVQTVMMARTGDSGRRVRLAQGTVVERAVVILLVPVAGVAVDELAVNADSGGGRKAEHRIHRQGVMFLWTASPKW